VTTRPKWAMRAVKSRSGDAVVVLVVTVDEKDLHINMFQRIVEVRQVVLVVTMNHGSTSLDGPLGTFGVAVLVFDQHHPFFPIFLSFKR
jgi:hypothetical protein